MEPDPLVTPCNLPAAPLEVWADDVLRRALLRKTSAAVADSSVHCDVDNNVGDVDNNVEDDEDVEDDDRGDDGFLLVGGPLHTAIADDTHPPPRTHIEALAPTGGDGNDTTRKDNARVAAVRAWAITTRWLLLAAASAAAELPPVSASGGDPPCSGDGLGQRCEDNVSDASLQYRGRNHTQDVVAAAGRRRLSQMLSSSVLPDMEWWQHHRSGARGAASAHPVRRNCIALPPALAAKATSTRCKRTQQGSPDQWHVHPAPLAPPPLHPSHGHRNPPSSGSNGTQRMVPVGSAMGHEGDAPRVALGDLYACTSCMDVLALALAARINVLVSSGMRGVARRNRMREETPSEEHARQQPLQANEAPSADDDVVDEAEVVCKRGDDNDNTTMQLEHGDDDDTTTMSPNLAECLAAAADACRGTTMRDGNACRYGRQWVQPAVVSFVFAKRTRRRGERGCCNPLAADAPQSDEGNGVKEEDGNDNATSAVASVNGGCVLPSSSWSLSHVVDTVNALVYTYPPPPPSASDGVLGEDSAA